MMYLIISLIVGLIFYSQLYHKIHTGRWIKSYKKLISIIFLQNSRWSIYTQRNSSFRKLSR